MKIAEKILKTIQFIDLDDDIQIEISDLYGVSNDSSFYMTMEFDPRWGKPWEKRLLDEYLEAGGSEGDRVLVEVCW